MAGNISNYAELKILDHSLGTTSWTKPTAVYIALYTSDPTDADSGAEVSGGAYARQAAAFDAAAAGATQNTSDITFPEATVSWGTITHIGIRDALTVGNLIWHGALTASKAIGIGDQFKIKAGELDISLD
jgi:hypothetical protein